MASPTAPHESAAEPSPAPHGRLVAYEQYIDDQLRKTGSTVKSVDLARGLMLWFCGALAYLLVVALIDHWLVPGGLGKAARFFFFVLLVAASGYYFATRLVVLAFKRINPVYSAYTIERSSPSLKNSLLNLLLFRTDRKAVPREVYGAMEQQAAQRLTGVPVDALVDRGPVVRLGYVLLGIVVACCLYKLLSPKDPLTAAGRVILPWSEIQPSTRVRILNVEPGNATAVRGEQLDVAADIRGARADEVVTLYYTTDDGQAVDRAVAMQSASDGLRYLGLLPESTSGLYDGLVYRIKAGDAVSPDYRIEVVAAPAIRVERIEYEYPEYTGLSHRATERQGDIKALEGTRVTLHARANYPIETAAIDFDCDGRRDPSMKVEGDVAKVGFTLALNKDRSGPKHACYALRFTTTEGRENREPIEYTIEVTPDLPPEVELRAPTESGIEVPLNGTVEIQTEAIDPDFKLQRVALLGKAGRRDVLNAELLDEPREGRLSSKFRLTPNRHDMKVGDIVDYWAEAVDNKTPTANRARSKRQRLRIVAPEATQQKRQTPDRGAPPPVAPDQPSDPQHGEGDKQGEQQPQEGGDPGEQEQTDQGQEGGGPHGQGGGDDQQPAGESQRGDTGEGSKSGQPQADDDPDGDPDGSGGDAQGVDPEGSDDGKLFDELLKDEQIREKLEKQQQRSGKGQEPGQQPPGGSPEQGGQPGAETSPNDDAAGQGEAPQQEGARPEQRQQPDLEGEHGDQPPQAGDRPEGQGGKGRTDRETPGEKSGERPKPTGDGGQDHQAKGKGGDAGSQPQPTEKQPAETDPSRPDARGGGQTPDSRDPGAGAPGNDDAGSPDPQEDIRPREGQPPEGGDRPPGADDPQSPAQGKHESKSQGAEQGDRPGGGEQGGGQDADQQGTGSAGQQTSADEGGGASPETGGQGESGDQAGDQGPAGKPTGESSNKQPGTGSKSQPADKGRQDHAPQDKRDSDEPKGKGGQGQNDSPPGASRGAGQGGPPTGGGGVDGDEQNPRNVPQSDQPEPGGDDPNLEYARKATDLVLDHLKDQLDKGTVDRKQLERMKLTPDQLERMIRRIENLKRAAEAQGVKGDAARKEYQDWLKSLGLRKGRVQRASRDAGDQQQGYRQGVRSSPPPEYADQVRAYQEGLNRLKPERGKGK